MQGHFAQKTADITGAVLSQLCLVHCLLLPVLVGLLPSLSWTEVLGGEMFHLLILILATPVAIFALLQGFRKHGSSRPAIFGAAALGILWGVFCMEESLNHDLVAAFNVMGGLMMAWAHWQNWTLTSGDCDSSCSCDH
jgi:hypothetical protein